MDSWGAMRGVRAVSPHGRGRPLNPECSPRRPTGKEALSGREHRCWRADSSGVDLNQPVLRRTPSDELRTRERELQRGLDAVVSGVPARSTVEEVDVVISGGGLRGYYASGALFVLAQSPGIRIRRIAGASAGAWCAAFFHSGLSLHEWVETYRETQAHVGAGLTLLEAYDVMKGCFPHDAYKRCSGKVFVSITTLDLSEGPAGLRNEIVSRFESNEDLVQACMASSCIPFVSDCGIGRRFRGKLVLDGGVINNHPFFRDGARRTVEMNLSKVNYPMWSSFTPVDPCVEALVMRGGLEARRFLAGHNDATSIQWVAKDSAHPDPNELGHRLRTAAKFTALLLGAAPCLLLFLALRQCSASFNAALKRGIGVTGSRTSSAFECGMEIIFAGVVLTVGFALGWQATLLLMCAVATAELLRLHDAEE